VRPPSSEVLERLRELADRRLSAREVEEALAFPISQEEREEMKSLITWPMSTRVTRAPVCHSRLTASMVCSEPLSKVCVEICNTMGSLRRWRTRKAWPSPPAISSGVTPGLATVIFSAGIPFACSTSFSKSVLVKMASA
jgi:hypothetical protein